MIAETEISLRLALVRRINIELCVELAAAERGLAVRCETVIGAFRAVGVIEPRVGQRAYFCFCTLDEQVVILGNTRVGYGDLASGFSRAALRRYSNFRRLCRRFAERYHAAAYGSDIGIGRRPSDLAVIGRACCERKRIRLRKIDLGNRLRDGNGSVENGYRASSARAVGKRCRNDSRTFCYACDRAFPVDRGNFFVARFPSNVGVLGRYGVFEFYRIGYVQSYLALIERKPLFIVARKQHAHRAHNERQRAKYCDRRSDLAFCFHKKSSRFFVKALALLITFVSGFVRSGRTAVCLDLFVLRSFFFSAFDDEPSEHSDRNGKRRFRRDDYPHPCAASARASAAAERAVV